MKFKEMIGLLEDDGWEYQYTRGAHRYFKHPTKPGKVTVSCHIGKSLSRNDVRDISKQAQLSLKK